jgi:glycosyltransferase involved in cell wall biosynthesis
MDHVLRPHTALAYNSQTDKSTKASSDVGDAMRIVKRWRNSTDTSRLTVHHFGPDPSCVGGVGGDVVVVHPTWRRNARFKSLPLALRAALTIVAMPRSDIAHIHVSEKGSYIREGALVLLARLCGHVTVVTQHAFLIPVVRRHPRLVSRVLRCAHVIICLDQTVLELARQVAPRAQITLVPNPTAVDHESPGADVTDEVVVYAGEISHMKGIDVLCRAWEVVAKSRPRARCILVGPPRDFAVPQIERLEARPAVDSEAVIDLLRYARVVVLPSRSEAMPMVLTEAMSVGRPFVSTPVGGVPSLAQSGGGVLVPVGDHVSLATSLTVLLADPQRARRLGEQGRLFCAKTRSVEVVGTHLRELYRNGGRR